jgi:hypothetical protein
MKFSGSTAVVCLIVGDATTSTIHVANVGDSRAVLSRAGVSLDLSRDQVATRPDEQARIEVGFAAMRRLLFVLWLAEAACVAGGWRLGAQRPLEWRACCITRIWRY